MINRLLLFFRFERGKLRSKRELEMPNELFKADKVVKTNTDPLTFEEFRHFYLYGFGTEKLIKTKRK